MKVYIIILASIAMLSEAHDHSEEESHDDEGHVSHVYFDWYSHESMSSAKSDMTATTVGQGIYVFGGCASNQVYIGQADFARYAGLPMNSADVQNFYANYYCGMFDGVSNSSDVYFPESHTWRTLPEMPRHRYRHAAAAVGTDIYVFGGTDDSDSIIYHVDKFDTVSETWSTLSQSMVHAYRDMSAFVYNDEIYAVGGYDNIYSSMSKVQKLDISSGSWTQVATLATSRGDCGVAVVGDSAYVVGGFNDQNWCAPMISVEKIDLSDMSLTSQGLDLAIGRGDKAVVALNERIHVMGGETKDSSCASEPLRDVEIYESEMSMWKYAGEIPYGLTRFRLASAAYESSIFLFGGQESLVGTLNTNTSYYPVTTTVLEYFEDMHTEVEDHDHDEHAIATASLVIGILGLVVGLIAIALYCGSALRSGGDNGAQCAPSMTKASEVTMVPLKNGNGNAV